MAQTKQQIQAMLAEAATSPRYRFGQNFMIDRNLVALVADAGQIAPADLVLEIGPGTGTLSEELLARASSGKVIAVEIDRDLAGMLRRHFVGQTNFLLIEGDALASKHRINETLAGEIAAAHARGPTVRLVANLPYNIASPLVIELLLAGVQHLAFTVQKEVALRLKSAAGSDDYGPLTVMAQLLASVEIDRHLPPDAFWPRPKIESSLVVMQRNDRLGAIARPFGEFVAALFAARRKMLRKALQQTRLRASESAFATLGLSGEERPEVLTPSQLLQLYQLLQG